MPGGTVGEVTISYSETPRIVSARDVIVFLEEESELPYPRLVMTASVDGDIIKIGADIITLDEIASAAVGAQ